jgi:hypothetical protein
MSYKTAFFIISNTKKQELWYDYYDYNNHSKDSTYPKCKECIIHNSDCKKCIKYIPECPICLDYLDSLKICIKLKACNHIFHDSCIKQYLSYKRVCPMCRCDINRIDKTTDTNTTNNTSSCICF